MFSNIRISYVCHHISKKALSKHFLSRLYFRSLLLDNRKHTVCSFVVISRHINTKYTNLRGNEQFTSDGNDEKKQELLLDNANEAFYQNISAGHSVLLIQPRVKSGPDWEKKSASEIKLAEAVALINTLPGWRVVDKLTVPVTSMNSKVLFGKGNLEKLKIMIQKNRKISAVFIGIDILTSLQNTMLESNLRIQVFDRYQVILQIFHDHAHTKEAKLQLALAEIPYLRVKLCSYSYTRDSSTFQGIQHVGGEGETFMEMRRRILNQRELKLKKELEKIKKQREKLRRSDSRNSFPIIAVVGYTNCGKTTLIKSLTNDQRLQPEDKLFATLDVTLHSAFLPSNQKVLFIDTVGFISDVPTALIQSFRSTLEEIHLSDLVIHIRDASHPDREMQKSAVLKTLKELDLPQKLLDTLIEVNNKIDLLEEPLTANDEGSLNISATVGTGLPNLLEIIEEKLLENTGYNVTLLRIPNGGAEYSWILREAAMRDVMADQEDANYLIAEVVMSPANLAKFIHMFGDLQVSAESIMQF